MSKVIENHELRFVCPECEGEGLNFMKEVICVVKAIFSDGRIETDEEHPYDRVAYECSQCEYKITDDGRRITEPESLIEWLLRNCPQSNEDFSESENEPNPD